MRIHFILAVALMTVPVAARQNGGSATCYNCDNFSGSWNCTTSSPWGGLTCTVTQNSCTVTGNCGSSSSLGSVGVGLTTLSQIATAHPRLGATVFELTKSGQVDRTASIFWNDDKMSVEQAMSLIRGEQVNLKPSPGQAIVFDATFETTEQGAELIIVPRIFSPFDPVFVEFRLELTPENGILVPRSWTLR